MAIEAAFEGSATIGATEWSLTTNTGGPDAQALTGVYQVFLDLNALGSGDTFELRIYEKVRSADSQRVLKLVTFTNAQSPPNWASESYILLNAFDVTLKKTAGTDRAIPWSIRRVR